MNKGEDKKILSNSEKNLIAKLREIPFGEVVIIMHNGQPDRIERGIIKEKL